MIVAPPANVAVLPRTSAALGLAEATHPRPWGPFNNDPRILGDVPVGGELHFTLDPEWITVAPSTMASPRTFVSFEGRTAYGERSAIPFHVTSADWEESDRVLAGIMTAFGSETTAVAVGGSGEFDGVMRLAFKHPRSRRFRGDRMRAGCHLRERRPRHRGQLRPLTNARVNKVGAHRNRRPLHAGYPC